MKENPDLKQTTVYPHQAVAIMSIASVWVITITMLAGIYFGKTHLPPELQLPSTGLAIFLIIASILFAIHRLLHYSNTYLTIAPEALIYKKGWIPSSTDNIFWVNIKDINTESSVTESLLKTGSIVIIVAIRTAIYQVKISYLPQHEDIAAKIRAHIGVLNQDARQVTYT